MATIADCGNEPNILFFRGIFPKQYDIENIFTNQLLASIEPGPDIYDTRQTNYDTLPRVFTTIDKWPRTSNLSCWHCHRQINGAPRFSPTRIIKGANSDFEITVCGAMCTFVCVASYIDWAVKNQIVKDNRHRMLKVLYYITHGVEINHISRIAPHTIMCQYGGTVSKADYYKMIDSAEDRLGSLI